VGKVPRYLASVPAMGYHDYPCKCDTADGREHMLIVPADVSSPESVRDLFAHIEDVCRRLDLLFNNCAHGIDDVRR
jgi:NAD(P)-dependent dehydrogenase (short-subunit alcohol dehydrogenase family)